MTHTPTPWKLQESKNITTDDNNIVVVLASQHLITGDDNAAFIVRAVNAHEDLLAALKEAREFVAFAASKLKYQSVGKEFEPNRESAEGTLGRMDQAIAKAEGK